MQIWEEKVRGSRETPQSYFLGPGCFGQHWQSGHLGNNVLKVVYAYPRLEVKLSINVSCTKMFFPVHVLCPLRLFRLKTEGQTIKEKS